MLESIPLFACLSEAERATLSHALKLRRFHRNAVIISEGDETQALYIIRKGTVKVARTHPDGKEVVIAVLGKGDYFGEIALIDGQPRSADVITKEPCECAVITKPEFDAILLENPALSMSIMRGLCTRLRTANRSIESLALMDVYGRVARLLLDLAKPRDDALVIEEPLTHKEIASMVGSSREMVSRILKDLTTGGYVSSQNKQLTINTQLPAAW